jgi:hypothetical protein
VKDPEVNKFAERLVAIRKVSDTEVVRRALLQELEREKAIPSLVDLGVDYCLALRARGNPASGLSADKLFVDSLYGNE